MASECETSQTAITCGMYVCVLYVRAHVCAWYTRLKGHTHEGAHT